MFIQAGLEVSGSDREDSPYIKPLRDLGATIHIGHDARHVGDASTVVVTSALWQDNPEYQHALKHGITVLHRSQALAWLIKRKKLITIAGAHGKTTSAGMIITALTQMGEDPSFVNGGVIQSLGVSADYGDGEYFVAEADESDGSFLLYNTSIALITNVDADHLDHYGSHDAFDNAFVEFASGADELVVISSDDPGAVRVRAALSGKVITFGESARADVRLSDVVVRPDGLGFRLAWQGDTYVASLSVPGRHNAINAAGAFAVLVGLGFEPQRVIDALGAFGGTKRRFELKGVVAGVSVYDDYAHHPTEAAAALRTARSVVGGGRVIAVHQPHLYSRTQLMSGEFARVYEELADFTIVLDVDGAREDPVPGVTGLMVSEQFRDPDRVRFEPDWQAAADFAAKISQAGDIVMTLSCGDVYRIVPQIVGSLQVAHG
jgi:UDP-N-acetylmuramate--alanine ligase